MHNDGHNKLKANGQTDRKVHIVVAKINSYFAQVKLWLLKPLSKPLTVGRAYLPWVKKQTNKQTLFTHIRSSFVVMFRQY